MIALINQAIHMIALVVAGKRHVPHWFSSRCWAYNTYSCRSAQVIITRLSLRPISITLPWLLPFRWAKTTWIWMIIGSLDERIAPMEEVVVIMRTGSAGPLWKNLEFACALSTIHCGNIFQSGIVRGIKECLYWGVDVPVFIAIVCPSSIVCFDEIVIFGDRYEAVNYLEHQCETGVCSSLR